MKLPTFTIDEDVAKQRLAAYQAMAAESRTAEDERIARGYRSIAKGFPVLRLSETIESGGYFDNGLPRIAIARADAKTCHVQRESVWGSNDRDYVFSDDEPVENRGALVGDKTVRITVPFRDLPLRSWYRGQTIVPIIPPELRPKPRRLRGFHILFEVEEWKQSRAKRAPADPALLRHIGGDLWSVVGVWDLSELEQAVLSGRGA